jgi:hypothetical protein
MNPERQSVEASFVVGGSPVTNRHSLMSSFRSSPVNAFGARRRPRRAEIGPDQPVAIEVVHGELVHVDAPSDQQRDGDERDRQQHRRV